MAPSTMRRYIVSHRNGIDGLVLEQDAPVPALNSPTSVRVNIKYLSLNARDLQIVTNDYPAPHVVPQDVVPVSDSCGIVEAVGDEVTLYKIGDKVCPLIFGGHHHQEDLPLKNMRRGLGGAVDGAAAEFLVCDEEDLVMMPKHMSMEEGSTLPVAFTTAWSSLFSHHPTLQAGQTVLCLGTGGVSLCAAQLALINGARVILTSSSDAKLERAKSLLSALLASPTADAIQLVNYAKIDKWDQEVKRLNDGRGVDFVIEIAGRGTLARSIRSTRPGGLVAVSGYLSDYGNIPKEVLEEDIAKTILYSAANVRGVFVSNRDETKVMVKALEYGNVHPVIDKTFSFDQMKEAYQYMAEGRHFGKVCIEV